MPDSILENRVFLNILILFMVEHNIDNNMIMKSFSLQLASVELDDRDFAQLEILISN